MANEYSADVPKGFNVPKQVRLDSITGIQNEETLKNLGSGNNLAFKYYDGLKVYCKDEKKEYIWRQVVGSETGLLTTHFVYPTYPSIDGIDYSGKSFNFFLVTNRITSSGIYTPTVNVITGVTSVSVHSHTYIKIGNIVTVYGESEPTPVVAGVPVIYEISLPIARANTATKSLGFGTMNVAGGSTNQPVFLESLSTTTVRISFNIAAAGTPTVLYSLQYDITQ